MGWRRGGRGGGRVTRWMPMTHIRVIFTQNRDPAVTENTITCSKIEIFEFCKCLSVSLENSASFFLLSFFHFVTWKTALHAFKDFENWSKISPKIEKPLALNVLNVPYRFRGSFLFWVLSWAFPAQTPIWGLLGTIDLEVTGKKWVFVS